jgi:hypothetical protein
MLLLAVTHVVIDDAPSPGTNLLTWVPVVTAVVAAVSAGLSWKAVNQAKDIWQRSLLPVLAPSLSATDKQLVLSVANTSKTIAAGAGWAVLWGDRRNEGHLPDRAVAPDTVVGGIELMEIREGMDDADALPGPVAVAWCRDSQCHLHFWDSTQRHRTIKKDKATALKPADLLARVRSDKAHEADPVCPRSELIDRI